MRLWLVVGGGSKIMACRGWSWMVARCSNTHYFHMKTKVLADFQIISVPLIQKQRVVKKRV